MQQEQLRKILAEHIEQKNQNKLLVDQNKILVDKIDILTNQNTKLVKQNADFGKLFGKINW